jgi:hypothetical protein
MVHLLRESGLMDCRPDIGATSPTITGSSFGDSPPAGRDTEDFAKSGQSRQF